MFSVFIILKHFLNKISRSFSIEIYKIHMFNFCGKFSIYIAITCNFFSIEKEVYFIFMMKNIQVSPKMCPPILAIQPRGRKLTLIIGRGRGV